MPDETKKPEVKEKGMGAEVIADLVLTGIQFLLKEAPTIADTIRTLVNKENPTDADFEAARAGIANDTYRRIVTNSQLPPKS